MNPQVRYGEDLMSRVSYVMMHPEGTDTMHAAVIATLQTLAERAVVTAGIALDDIVDVVLVGNTVMHHLLLGISPVELGGAPFALAVSEPVDLKARGSSAAAQPGRARACPILHRRSRRRRQRRRPAGRVPAQKVPS